MRDWPTIIALLLRESDDLISSALRPSLAAILLRMFVASAMNLREWYAKTRAVQLDEDKPVDSSTGKGKKEKVPMSRRRNLYTHRLEKEDLVKLDEWEALGEHLNRDLPRMLVRFRDDKSNLSTLVTLFSCCDVTTSNKSLKALLKSTMELFEQSSSVTSVGVGATGEPSEGGGNSAGDNDHVLLNELCKALREWSMLGGATKGAVDNAVATLLTTQWGRVEGTLESLKRASASLAALASEMHLDNDKATTKGTGLGRGRAKGKKSLSSAADEIAEAEEAIYTTAAAIGSHPLSHPYCRIPPTPHLHSPHLHPPLCDMFKAKYKALTPSSPPLPL